MPSEAPRAVLTFVGAEETAALLHRSATSLVLTGGGGSYLVRVEAEDPREPLSTFRLSARFVAERATGAFTKSETDGELEIEPDPLRVGPWLEKPAVPSRYDLDSTLALLAPRLSELCGQGETDDHGDSFLCATAVARNGIIQGEIGNSWGDDVDVFLFRLPNLATLEIRAEGDLAGGLYNGHGQRLAVVGSGTGPRLVRTLVPGAYFLRVEGRDGAVGRYLLVAGSPSAKR